MSMIVVHGRGPAAKTISPVPALPQRQDVDAEQARQLTAQAAAHPQTEAPSRNSLRLHLRTADGRTAHRAEALLVRAFSRTPLARWLYPDLSQRGSRLHAAFSQLIENAVDNGSVVLAHQNGMVVGVVLWTICPGRDETDPAPTAFLPDDPGDPDNPRLAVLADRLAQCHPPEPHEHLRALAVHPGYQRHGIASALLTSATHPPAAFRFLVTPGCHEQLLPQRGYQPHGEPIMLPDDGPRLRPFWWMRPPPQANDRAPHRQRTPTPQPVAVDRT